MRKMTPLADLDRLAKRIAREHQAITTTLVDANHEALRHAFRAGHSLAEAKARLGHGRFLPWVRESCHMGERRAQEYMLVAHHESQIRGVAHISLRSAMNLARHLDLDARRAAYAAGAATMSLSERCDLRHCSMQDLLSSVTGLDAIICDPPYAKEYLPIYGDLARLAKSALNPDGVLALLCGNASLAEVLAVMSPHMTYRWTMAYLFNTTNLRTKIYHVKMGAQWKPVVLFGQIRDWGIDTVSSGPVTNDKEFHKWGQSEQGMRQIVERLTRPNDLVCDPFLGGGTTALVALQLGRRFVGCDSDQQSVQITQRRLHDADLEKRRVA